GAADPGSQARPILPRGTGVPARRRLSRAANVHKRRNRPLRPATETISRSENSRYYLTGFLTGFTSNPFLGSMKSTHLDADRNHFLPGKKFEPHGKKSPPGPVMSEPGRDGWPVTKGRD